jgi:selenocysteine lyase/cysteine desulfurase
MHLLISIIKYPIWIQVILHRWLYNPIGRGLLHIWKRKIKTIHPSFAISDYPLRDDIRKFEDPGTLRFFIEKAIGETIESHEMIGSERKEKRLHYLKNYRMEKVQHLPKAKLNTSLNSKRGCAIGNVGIDVKKPGELDSFLFEKCKIHSVGIVWENMSGERIIPNVYASTKNLDLVVEGITAFAKS